MTNPAQVYYRPTRSASSQPVADARASLEAALKSCAGVQGFGVTRDKVGDPAIAVYVRAPEDLNRLPSFHQGFPVVGLLTGDIDAFSE